MNNLLTRTISGAVYVALIVAAIWVKDFGLAFFGVLMLVSVYEFLAMNRFLTKRVLSFSIFAFVAAAYFSATMIFTNQAFAFLIGVGFGSGVVLLATMFAKTVNPLKKFLPLLAIVYVALPYLLAPLWLGNDAYFNAKNLLILFVIIWVNDSFAYLFGVSFGKHKLWPQVSPKKSWEGFVGGAVMSVISGVLVVHFKLISGFSFFEFVLFVLITIIAATFGDLLESKFKREAGVKDSGNIIPGHGGVLDRLDSFILALPMVSFLFLLFNML